MKTESKCMFCAKTGHNLQTCNDPEIQIIISGMEKSISNRYTWGKIARYLNEQSAIHVRILSCKNKLNPRIQKAFLNEKLIHIYYSKHKLERLRELGQLIARHLQTDEMLYTIEDFQVGKLESYLYNHLDFDIQNININEPREISEKLNYISRSLNSLYNCICHVNTEQYDRYLEFIPTIYNSIMNIQHVLRTRLMFFLRDQDSDEDDACGMKIVPYLLVSYSAYNSREKKYCPICMDSKLKNEMIMLKCEHHLCNTCLKTQVDMINNKELHSYHLKCSICRADIREIYTPSKKVYEEYDIINENK